MNELAAKRAFPIIFCARLLDAIGFGIIMPVLPALLMQVGDIPLADATRTGGTLFVTYALLQFLCGPLMGLLSDQFGRRPVILFSLAAYAIDYVFMALAPTLAWLFIGRAIAGIAGAVYAPANAFVADITPPEQRAKVFGQLSAAFGFGFILGPAIGGWVGELGPRAPFLVAAALSAINFTVGFFVLPESLPLERRVPVNWRRANPLSSLLALGRYGGVIGIVLAYFLFSTAFNVYPATWSYYLLAKFDWSPWMIGFSYVWSGIFMAVVQIVLVGPIVARLGEANAAKLGMASAIIGCLAYAFVPEGWMVFVIQPLVSLQMLTFPSINALISRRVAATEQGALQGVMGSMSALGSVFGPLILTQCMAAFTEPGAAIYFPGAAFALAATIIAASLIWLTLEVRRPAGARSA
jgi:DHA1 family tetracycline resistance protein-like MFS transporter